MLIIELATVQDYTSAAPVLGMGEGLDSVCASPGLFLAGHEAGVMQATSLTRQSKD